MTFKPMQDNQHLPPWTGLRRWQLLINAGLCTLGAVAGSIAFNVDLPSAAYPWSIVQGFILAGAVLAIALRVCFRRIQVFLLVLGWYLGSLAALPFTWHAFFGNGWGCPTWVVLAVLLALPGLLAPRRWPALGILPAVLIASVPPLGFIGLCNPLLVAGALFPGAGWLGLLLVLMFFGLSAFRGRTSTLLQMLMLGYGLVVMTRPATVPPDSAWAATTFDGLYPVESLMEGFKRQDGSKATVKQALEQGAKLVLMPETTNPLWDDGQAFYWQDVTGIAAHASAQVLLGVYTNSLSSPEQVDGLVDLASGKIYPASIAMPIAMWRPWSTNSFPLHMRSAGTLIPTAAGPAAHLVCYEELLMWPLATQELHGHPALLLSAANQWFAGGWIARPQSRSVALQARLWGLPLLRAVNHQSVDL